MKSWFASILLLAIALVLILIAIWFKKTSGLPSGRLIYADTDQLQAVPGPLFDPNLRLVGKPDYVLRLANGALVPVDFKSTLAPVEPYRSHVFQVLAYCYLLEQNYGQKPPYGLIRYQDKSFEVPYDELEKETFLRLISQLRTVEASPDAPNRSHKALARCRGCGYRDSCDQSLI
ncbi:MAG: Dna2/Cas4 domain-containing protein [Chloroflexi bacterium]|nr:Dna2/Cas4 domain-containing protein [Chloroflexota bacterium]